MRAVVIGVVTAALFFAATMLSMRFPPAEIKIATGPPGGAYEAAGKLYRSELARRGTLVDLVESRGSPQNLQLLHDVKSGVVAALVQGGITSERDQADLESLGTVFYEPLFLFVRGEQCAPVCGLQGLIDIARRRVSIGGPDSGTQVLARAVLASLSADQPASWQTLPVPQAREALLRGEIDAAFVVEAWGSGNVQALLHDPAIHLMDYPVADALIDVSPSLHHVVLPRGARSLADDLPPADLNLVAPKASLVVRQDLHPAVKYLLLEAMRRVHGKPAMFTKSNEFPAPEAIGLRLSETARMFYARSEPWYYALLPYWMADVIAAAVAIAVPAWALLYAPLAKMLAQRRAHQTHEVSR